MKKIVKLTEQDVENLVKKIIVEEQSITSQLDDVINRVRGLQREYEDFANSVTGSGYMDEIDGITRDINKLETKLLDVKSKTHELRRKKEHEAKQGKMAEMKKVRHQKQGEAIKKGDKYYY